MSKNQSKKTIKGAKMFQDELRLYKLHLEYIPTEVSRGMTAATLSCAILLHFICDKEGMVRAEDFNLKQSVEKYGLPYSSIHKGFQNLFALGLLHSIYLGDQEYYALHEYEQMNDAVSQNYFNIPEELLSSGILNEFIRARDVRGLVYVLDLCNGLSREYQKGTKSPALRRNISKLIEKMHKTTRNIKGWLKRIEGFFEVDYNKGRRIMDWKIVCDLRENCFRRLTKEEKRVNQLSAFIDKEMRPSFKNSLFNLTTKDMNDAQAIATQEMIELLLPAYNTNIEEYFKSRLVKVSTNAFENLIDIAKTTKVGNVMGLFRNQVRKLVAEWVAQMVPDQIIEIKANLLKKGKKFPKHLDGLL